MPIAKTFPKPRPAPIVTDSNILAAGTKDAAPPREGENWASHRTLSMRPRPKRRPPSSRQRRWTAEEWVDSSVSSGMEEFMRKAAPIEQPEQLTPVAASQPRADVITAGRKNAGSPAKLRRVGGEEADRGRRRRRTRTCSPRRRRRERNAGTGGVEEGRRRERSPRLRRSPGSEELGPQERREEEE